MKKPPDFKRSKGMLYADWKTDWQIWLEGTSLSEKEAASATYFALEENEKSLLRVKVPTNENGSLDLTIEGILKILDKEVGKDLLIQTMAAYQNWKQIAWRDKRLTIEEYNVIYDDTEKKLHQKVLRDREGRPGDPENLHTTFRAFH